MITTGLRLEAFVGELGYAFLLYFCQPDQLGHWIATQCHQSFKVNV